jgi:hypothetical protein
MYEKFSNDKYKSRFKNEINCLENETYNKREVLPNPSTSEAIKNKVTSIKSQLNTFNSNMNTNLQKNLRTETLFKPYSHIK